MKSFFFKLNRFAFLFILSSCISVLSACHSKTDNYIPLTDTTYKLPSRVQDSSDKVVAKMLKHFNKGKIINVMTIGQYYLISIPSNALFADQSPRIKTESYNVLNQVSDFMKQFRKISVTVTSYSNMYKSTKRQTALTLARARGVGDYLQSQGIDSRFIFTEGGGSEKPISTFTNGGDGSPNSRIEIVFRDAIVN